MPISTVLSLIPQTDAALRPTMGHHAHAAFLSILKQTNPELATALHAQTSQKPFTVSPLQAKGKSHNNRINLRAGTDCKLRFTFLDDALFAEFGQAFLALTMPPIRLGEATFQVKQWVSHATEAQTWSANASYTQIVQSALPETQFRIKFYSPTSFRALTPRGQKTYTHTQVDLVRCYRSWVKKWNAFAPMQIDERQLLNFIAAHARLSEAHTRTRAHNFGTYTVIGWVGTCTCRFEPTDKLNLDLLYTANWLADFAFYSGTGYKTTMGMGQTKRIPLKQGDQHV